MSRLIALGRTRKLILLLGGGTCGLFASLARIEAFDVTSDSMLPTLEIGDRVLVWRQDRPRRGDVVVFESPFRSDAHLIKRVLALPGERVDVKDNQVLINGGPLRRERTAASCPNVLVSREMRDCEIWRESVEGAVYVTRLWRSRRIPGVAGVVVPPGNVFVVGDDRDNPKDSRTLGSVPRTLIVGRALLVLWSADATGSLRWRRFLARIR